MYLSLNLEYNNFKKKFFELTGFNLDCYKDKQMERRIRQFIKNANIDNFYTYYKLIKKNEQERIRFLNFLTINTTSFFRDIPVFEKLEKIVFPELIHRKKTNMKIWSAGCSVGAEPYSIAILMKKFKKRRASDYKVIATDIDEVALEKAKAGIFEEQQLKSLYKKTIKEDFMRIGNQFKIKPELQNNIVFKKHDLLSSFYESNFDLILCRNVFIYFTQEAQDNVIKKFANSLNPQGYFVLGSSENIVDHERFDLKKVEVTIFQKKQ